MHTYYFRSIWKGIFLLLSGLCLIGLIITQENARPQAVQAAEDVIPRQATLALSLTAPEAPATLGEEITFWAEVANRATSTLTNVTLMLPGHHDLVYLGAGDYELTGNTVRLGNLPGGSAVRIPLRVGIQGLPANDLSLPLKVWAVEADSVDTTLTLGILKPAAESADLGITPAPEFGQGLVSITGAEMKENGRLQFQLHEQHQLPAGDAGTVLAFSVTPPEGTPADTFTTADLHLNIADLVNAETRAAGRLRLYFRPTGSETWAEATFSIEVETGTLTKTGMRFGEYLLLNEPEPWEPSYNPPGASAYSGAAQFSYGIDVPPGVGGLTPSLGLSYGSRSLDEKSAPAMAFGFGLGWGMPQAEITNGNAGKMYDTDPDWNICWGGFNNRRFTLALNGVSYVLEPVIDIRHGQYIAIGDPSIKVEYISAPGATPNVTGEYWRVQTADGTTYQFGFQPDAEQVIAPLFEGCYQSGGSGDGNNGQPRNKMFIASSWKLDTIIDKFGNQIRYAYETACGLNGGDPRSYPLDGDGGGSHCTEVDAALKEIRYNFDSNNQPRTVIEFQNGIPGNTRARREKAYMLVGLYQPGNIVIKQDGNNIRRYHFDYDVFEHRVDDPDPYGLSFWWITSVTQYGIDENGSEVALPPLTFNYDWDTNRGCSWDTSNPPQWRCIYLLTQVENGYGAVSKIAYETFNNNGIWNLVKDVYTWDGVAHIYNGSNPAMVQTRYDRTSAIPCFDNGDTPGCQAPHNEGEDSDKLVGFDRVTITAGAPANMPDNPLSEQRQTFNTSNYWLNGKVLTSAAYDLNNNTKLTESISDWTWVENEHFARLNQVESWSYDTGAGNFHLATCQTYSYDVVLQNGRQWGQQTGINSYRYSGGSGSCGNVSSWKHMTTSSTRYVSNTSSGEWLLIPVESGLYDASWNILQTTLSFYDDNDPTVYGTITQPITNGELTLSRKLLVNEEMTTPVGPTYRSVDIVYDHDPFGNPTSITTFADYGVAGYSYAGNGNWDIGSPPGNLSTAYTQSTHYSANGWLVEWVQNNAGVRTTFVYDNPHYAWLPTAVTNHNERTMYYKYDPLGRLYEVYDGVYTGGDPDPWQRDPLTRYIYWDYDWELATNVLGDGNASTNFAITTQTRPYHFPDPDWGFPNSEYTLDQLTYYDGLGRPFQTRARYAEVGDGNGVQRQDLVTITQYDALGRTTCTTAPFAINTTPGQISATCDAQHPYTAYEYDALGRTTLVTAPDNSTTTTDFYHINHIVVDDDDRFLLTNVTDANGHATSYLNNALGQLVMVQEVVGNSPANYAAYSDTRYTYDVLGNLIQVMTTEPSDAQPPKTAALRTSTMIYDAFGRKLTMDDADMGHWTYVYDPAGNLIRQTDANNVGLCFYYDNLNRLVRKTRNDLACPALANAPVSGPDHLASYLYYGSDPTIPVGSRSQLKVANWGPQPTQNFEQFTYDARSRWTEHERVIDGRLFTMTINEFDVLDRPLAIIYPNGETVRPTYDREGENGLDVYNNAVFQFNLVSDVRFNALGQMSFLARGNRADTRYTYFDASQNFRLQTIQHGALNSDNLPDFTYAYDMIGNITDITAVTAANGTDSQHFEYDELNRLILAQSLLGSANYDVRYEYNLLGNITRRTNMAAFPPQAMNYDYAPAQHNHNQPHAVKSISGAQGGTFMYDANGNMIDRQFDGGDFTQVFDVENRLISVTDNSTNQSTTFMYDAAGQRVMTQYPDGRKIYYPFSNYEEELSSEVPAPSPTPTNTPVPPTPTNTPVPPTPTNTPVPPTPTNTPVPPTPTNTPVPPTSTPVGDNFNQAMWRGNQGWTMSAPVVGGSVDWGSASNWNGPAPLSSVPGSGALQTEATYVIGVTFYQVVWRGNQGWSRTAPINGGLVNWGAATPWNGPIPLTVVPGSGTLQAQATFVIGNTLYESIWRGNQGWSRAIPIVNGTPDFNNSGPWNGPTAITGLPGSGNMQALAAYVIGNNLFQSFWRGNQGWTQTVPIVNGNPQWHNNWNGPIALSTLPGSGDMQTLAAYVVFIGGAAQAITNHESQLALPGITPPPTQPGPLARLLGFLGGLVADFQAEASGWWGASRPLADNTAVTTRPVLAKQGPGHEFADIKQTPTPSPTLSPTPPPPASEVMGEVGLINDTLTHTPQTIILSRSYQNPVVFAQPISRDETNTAVARITNVQADRFTLFVHEAPNQNGNHTTEAVSYLVLEAGVWELPGGVRLEVGKQTTAATVGPLVNNQWAMVPFSTSFGGQTPVIISQVQTNNDPTWVKTRQTDRSATGFKAALEAADSANTAHGAETIGWLAITPANGNWNGRPYQAANTGDVVTSSWTTISFSAGFSSAPRFVAGLATYDEADGAALRYSRLSLTSSGVQVMVEEDTTWDSETTHTSEVVSYVAIQGNGTLTAVRRQTVIQRTTYHLAGQAIAVKVSGSPTEDGLYYLHSDHLGSASVLSNASGAAVPGSEARYLPFGDWRTEPTSNPGLTDMGFTGHKHNNSGSNDLGLIYMNARYYVPGIGRFASADTIVPDPANPQSYNRYTYVLNSPVNFTDPTGHRECGGPFDPACAEEPLTPHKPPPRTYVSQTLAQIIFDDMADETDIPFAFPADGCYARSQQMIQRIIERYNINPDSIQQVYINGLDTELGGLFIQTDFVYPDTSEYPWWVNHNENVAWGWHVAPLIVVVTANGGVGMVFDPSLLTDGPATINDWAAIMNNPDATITIVNRHWYTPAQTNVDESDRAERSQATLSEYLDYCRNAGYCE